MPSEKLLSNRKCDDNRDSRCWKSADYVFGIDNTKTRFNQTLVIELQNSDGTTSTFTQTPQVGWTEQIELWATEIQAIYPDCDVSPRCNIAGGCGGLLPPPANATLPSMFARYVSIICCPGSVYPTGATVIERDGKAISLPLIFEGGQLPETRGWMCVECEGDIEWFDQQWNPLAPADIPACWFECAETIPGADLACSWEWQDGCDDATDPPTPVMALWKTCEGQTTFDGYYANDNSGGLDDYTLTGVFVDCDTGEPVQPPANCTICDLIDVFDKVLDTCPDDECPDTSCATPRYSWGTVNTTTGSVITNLSIDGTNIVPAGGSIASNVAAINAAIAAAGYAGQIEAFTTATGQLRVRSTEPCGPRLTGLSGEAGAVGGPRLRWFSLIAIGVVIPGQCQDKHGFRSIICNIDDLADAIACAIAEQDTEQKPHIVVERICVKESVNGESVLVPKLVSILFDCTTGAYLSHVVNDMPDIPDALDCCTGNPIGGPIDG